MKKKKKMEKQWKKKKTGGKKEQTSDTYRRLDLKKYDAEWKTTAFTVIPLIWSSKHKKQIYHVRNQIHSYDCRKLTWRG